MVYGGREAVTAIVEHPDVRAIQFVGSTAVGRYVYETGTRLGKRVGSYTSAKNAMLVLPDADMELTADAAVASGYGSAGERCMAQTLVIAVGDVADRLRPLMLERIARLKVGPGMEPGMDMGPIYSAEHRESVISWIDKGVSEGAELVVDGRAFHHPEHPDGYFLGVTLFDNVTPAMEDLPRGESSGPSWASSGSRPTTRRSRSSTPTGTRTGRPSSRPMVARRGASSWRWTSRSSASTCPSRCRPATSPSAARGTSAFGDLAMRGEDGIRFFTQQKMVTERWPQPGRRAALSLVFPGNR